MTATITVKEESVFGNKRIVKFAVALGTYATGGVSVTAADLGMRSIDFMLIDPGTDGYEYEYIRSTALIKAYRCGGYTPVGTVSGDLAVTATQANFTVGASGTTGAALYISADSAAGKLDKEATTARVIPMITFGFGATSGVLSTGPTFVGTSVAPALVEVQASLSLATATRAWAIGD